MSEHVETIKVRDLLQFSRYFIQDDGTGAIATARCGDDNYVSMALVNQEESYQSLIAKFARGALALAEKLEVNQCVTIIYKAKGMKNKIQGGEFYGHTCVRAVEIEYAIHEELLIPGEEHEIDPQLVFEHLRLENEGIKVSAGKDGQVRSVKKAVKESAGSVMTFSELGLTVSKYHNSILVKGKTRKNLKLLRKIKRTLHAGVYNPHLKGWLFPERDLDTIISIFETEQ